MRFPIVKCGSQLLIDSYHDTIVSAIEGDKLNKVRCLIVERKNVRRDLSGSTLPGRRCAIDGGEEGGHGRSACSGGKTKTTPTKFWVLSFSVCVSGFSGATGPFLPLGATGKVFVVHRRARLRSSRSF